jgi:hypothetical protein
MPAYFSAKICKLSNFNISSVESECVKPKGSRLNEDLKISGSIFNRAGQSSATIDGLLFTEGETKELCLRLAHAIRPAHGIAAQSSI